MSSIPVSLAALPANHAVCTERSGILDDQLQPAVPPSLVRSLGVTGVLLLTLSVATPASSVFVIVPGVLQIAGTGAALAMLLAAIVCVATAFVYTKLSSAWPDAGGE